MILIVGTIRLPPDGLAIALPAMRSMIEGSRAEAACIHYSYAQDVLDTCLIHVKELWRDAASLEEHFRTDHIAQWRAAWPALGITDRNLVRYEVGEAQPT